MDMHDQHAADNADNIGLTLPPIEESLPMVQQKIMPKTSNQVTEIYHAGQICRYYYFSLALTFSNQVTVYHTYDHHHEWPSSRMTTIQSVHMQNGNMTSEHVQNMFQTALNQRSIQIIFIDVALPFCYVLLEDKSTASYLRAV